GGTLFYLAKIAFLSGDPAGAEREARAAADALEDVPPLRANAVAALARALLAQGRPEEALAAAGATDESEKALVSAREHLMSRAAKISDPKWRERFLTCVPDNARTL